MTRRSLRLPLFKLFMLGYCAVSQDRTAATAASVAALLLKHTHSCGADWWLLFKMVWISGRHWTGQMLGFHTWRILGGGDYFGVVLKHSPLAQPEAGMTWLWPSDYFGSDLGGAHSFRGRATAASTWLHAELASVGEERLSLCLLFFSSRGGFSAAHLTSGTICHVLFASSERMRFIKLNLTGRH